MAVIQDLTPEESLRQRQELLDRAAFWTDLAASMSHEVRNPLVAIKTFAQLLPERFDDADFRRDFNEIVVQEIDRLDLIITQINNFAHPPELNFKSIDLRAPMKKAVELVRARSVTQRFLAGDDLSGRSAPNPGRRNRADRSLRPPGRERGRSHLRPDEGEDHPFRASRSARATTPAEWW